MTDLMSPSPSVPTPPPSAPTSPPSPRSPDTPPQPPRSGRSGWRFTTGLASGIVVTGLAAGAIALATRDGSDSDAGTTAAPTTTVTADSAAPASGPGSVHDIVVQVRPSIVAIHTTLTQTDIFGNALEGEAAGSGFVLSSDGYVVTNDHVVDGADEIAVTFDDGTTEQADLVAADPRSDLAVLRVDRDDLVPLPIGDSDAIQVGDPVVAIGNALDLGAEPTVTGGMISAKDRTITEQNGQVLVNLIQTDAAISPGNSGGPLVDLSGRVVGINTAVAGQGQNIGFAIAINPAQQLIDQLREGSVPRHALLGVSTRPSAAGDTTGAVVMSVEPDSGADRGGVRVGDVITSLDGDPVTSPEDLVAAIARHQPGDRVEVTVLRGERTRTLDVTLGAHDETSS